MSIIPLFFDLADDPLENLLGLNDKYPNHFGLGIYPHEFRQHPSLRRSGGLTSWPGAYQRPWISKRNKQDQNEVANQTSSNVGKDGFQVSMDVEHFAPNEISVKTVDNFIVVEGKHEEKEDQHGQIYRHFVRRYELPKECDVKDVVSTLSSDGILTIKAPPVKKAIETNERVVQIQQTGPAHLSVKANPKDKSEEKMAE